MKLFDRLRMWIHPAGGGRIPNRSPGDSRPVMLTPGELITDPDRAEALGLNVEARKMREQSGPGDEAME